MRVLLVEDDLMIGQAVQDALKDFNQDFGLAPGQNPFIIIDKLRNPEAGELAGDAADRMARLEARLEQMEKMLREALKDKGEKPADIAPSKPTYADHAATISKKAAAAFGMTIPDSLGNCGCIVD